MREEAPSKDSIRRDQIKRWASSIHEADRLTVCPIWASGTVGVGAWGVLRSLQPAAPPPLGTRNTNSDNNTEICSQNSPYTTSIQRGCRLWLRALRHCLALACKQGCRGRGRTESGPAPWALQPQASRTLTPQRQGRTSEHRVWQPGTSMQELTWVDTCVRGLKVKTSDRQRQTDFTLYLQNWKKNMTNIQHELDERHTHIQLQSSKESTPGQGVGLRMAVKDRHSLITAERDGERDVKKWTDVNNVFRDLKPNQLDRSLDLCVISGQTYPCALHVEGSAVLEPSRI